MPILKIDKRISKQYVLDLKQIMSWNVQDGDEIGRARFHTNIKSLVAGLPMKVVGKDQMKMAEEFRDMVNRIPSYIISSVLFKTHITAFDIFRVFNGMYPEVYYETKSAFPKEANIDWKDQFALRAVWYMSREDFDVVAEMKDIDTNDSRNSLMLTLIYSEAKPPQTFIRYYSELKEQINDPNGLIIPFVCMREAQQELEALDEIGQILSSLFQTAFVRGKDK